MDSRLAGLFRHRRIDPDCREIRDISSDFIDEEMDGPTEGWVKSHLERCGPCSAFVNTLRATINLLRASHKQEASDGFLRRIKDSLPKDPSD